MSNRFVMHPDEIQFASDGDASPASTNDAVRAEIAALYADAGEDVPDIADEDIAAALAELQADDDDESVGEPVGKSLLRLLKKAIATSADRDGDDIDDSEEYGPGNARLYAELMADVLYGIFGDSALAALKSKASPATKAFAAIGLLLKGKWDSNLHHRGNGGRFIPRGSGEARAAAKEAVGKLKGKPATEGTVKELTGHLYILTVKQLKELHKEHGVKAPGKLREQLVAALMEKLPGAKAKEAPKPQPEEPAAAKQAPSTPQLADNPAATTAEVPAGKTSPKRETPRVDPAKFELHREQLRQAATAAIKGHGLKDSLKRNTVYLIFRNDEAIRLIPPGSKFLGSGLEAVAFKSPDGTVVRLEPNRGPRPGIAEVLQPISCQVAGEGDKAVRVEILPFAKKVPAELAAKVIPELHRLLAAQGYVWTDDKAANLGLVNGEVKIIDPGNIKRTDGKQ